MSIASALCLFRVILGAQTTPSPETQPAVHWEHPAGLVTSRTLIEVKDKIRTLEWAEKVYTQRKVELQKWLTLSPDQLRRVFPKRRGNVYHNFSCPNDRCRLTFDPFNPDRFECPICHKGFDPNTDPGVYGRGQRYHGTMYDGWACLFYQLADTVAADMAVIARVEGDPNGAPYLRRGIDLLLLYADTIEPLKVSVAGDRASAALLTYHREGDNKILNGLAKAYELLRDHMSPVQRDRFERVVLRRMLDEVMLEPIYTTDWNNVYQWHQTILQVALCLERDDLIDWVFGYGAFDVKRQPEHRSLQRIIATHFKPDGAFWEMCSGYHLYPMFSFCEIAVLSHHLSEMDPVRFPANRYDLTDRASPGGDVIHAALEWFVAMAMPDRTMPTQGDSPAPRAGMDDYFTTAEVGYRFFGVKAIGDYESLRKGQRNWVALLYGSPRIERQEMPFSSSYLSSGWVSLRNEWQGNRVWVGLNALIAGGGHQHADRLALLLYSQGELLALEKGTPYNEAITRELGTLSPMHNTVAVDKASQKQGESLSGNEVPKVAHFVSGPVVRFAELHGDHIYPQTSIYRRSVALFEDVAVDLFRVVGGSTHDWIVHHAGGTPQILSGAASATRPVALSCDTVSFEPKNWLAHGTDRIRHARTDEAFNARWTVGGVTSRMTLMGSPATEVFALETYPVGNAIVTPGHPPCQTLCVRRTDNRPFLAVWDAWRTSPNLQDLSHGEGGDSLKARTLAHTYCLIFGPGRTRFGDGVSLSTDGAFALVRDKEALLMVGGRTLEVVQPTGTLRVAAERPITVSAEYDNGILTIETCGDIHYDTRGGADHYREAPSVAVEFEGTLWSIRERHRRVVGQVR